MIDRFQPLMLSRGAAAMDTFDFALRWDPMASRLTRRTGQDPGRPASHRAVTPGVAQAPQPTINYGWKISTRSAQLPHPISACQARTHADSTRQDVSDTGEE
jgi:hypothetical protein